jgi:hypothetical protein
MSTQAKPRFRFEAQVPSNGRLGKATVLVIDLASGTTCHADKVDVASAPERDKFLKRVTKALGITANQEVEKLRADFSQHCHDLLDRRRRHVEAAAAGSPEAARHMAVAILDAQPDSIRRPLCLLREHAYAVTWLDVQTATTREVDARTGAVTIHDPPRLETRTLRVIVRDDGQAFAEGDTLPRGVEPFAKLGVGVSLTLPPPADRVWSGAGVKRFLAGERPAADDVWRRLAAVVDRFVDFNRSLATQQELCELTACYVLATYLLDAFHVVGYLWPNGEKGAGKTTYLQVVAETAYLGQLILAGGSYATLRDLADYGASLAFDDAEDVMDRKKGDPDKRTLLLAGNRRGAQVTVKEPDGDRWVTRYVQTFCPRQFSAIRLPDDVLGSRTLVIPLVRSGDARRAKSTPTDPAAWPCDRRRLVDDLWALALVSLKGMKHFDERAAGLSPLVGRELEPWRNLFAVALWLEEEHGVAGLFGRMTALAAKYQAERPDLELADPVRLAIKALLRRTAGQAGAAETVFQPKDLAEWMNDLAVAEDLAGEASGDKAFTNARRVGWMLKRLRLDKAPRTATRRCWKTTRQGIENLACAYGVVVEEGDDETEVPAEKQNSQPQDDQGGPEMGPF